MLGTFTKQVGLRIIASACWRHFACVFSTNAFETLSRRTSLCVTTNACLEHSRDKKPCVFPTSVCQKHFLEELVSNPTHAYDFWHEPSTILAELHFIAAHAHLLQTRQNRNPEEAAPEANKAAPIFTRIPLLYQMQRFQYCALTRNRNRCSRIDRVQDLQIDHCLPMVQSGHAEHMILCRDGHA